MADACFHEERVCSNRTEAVFIGLALLFLLLFAWRAGTAGTGVLAVVFLCLFGLFLFYSLNYRTLVIRLTDEFLVLRFGVFTWRMPWDAVASCRLDDISLWRIGGAGIHFTFIRKRYRAYWNFLEHPRVVLVFKKRRGLVHEVAFSTRRPGEFMQVVIARIGRRNDQGAS